MNKTLSDWIEQQLISKERIALKEDQVQPEDLMWSLTLELKIKEVVVWKMFISGNWELKKVKEMERSLESRNSQQNK